MPVWTQNNHTGSCLDRWPKTLQTNINRCCPRLMSVAMGIVLLITVSGCGAPTADSASSSPAPVEVSREESVATEMAEQSITTEPAAEPLHSAPTRSHELSSKSVLRSDSSIETRMTRSSAPVPATAAPSAAPTQAIARHQYSNHNSLPQSQHSAQDNSDFATGSIASTPAPQTAAVPKQKVSAPDAQPVAATLPATNQPSQVEVFYATDRQRVASISKGEIWKVFGWAAQLGLIALIAGFIGSYYQRQGVKLIAAVACIACLVLGYGGWIEWQQRTRLKDDGDVWYTHDIKTRTIASTNPLASPEDNSDLLDYGTCVVSIPPNHQIGTVEAPSITRFELVEDPDKHVVLEKITRSDSSEFFGQLNERLDQGSNEALIFIHGYNVSFNNAVKRTAQISHDVKFQGTPICYSWPSRGGLEDYTRDMANADWSVIHLQDFLASLFEQSQAKKIHLIAHSMGNRVLMQALDRLALQNQTETRFGQIVLAAPDVSANDFRQRYSSVIRQMSEHVTLYASSRDRALMVSASVHGHDRAGLAGDGIVVVEGIDTIDVSHVDTSLIGHSYYGDNPELIDDLAAIILQAQPTASRSWLRRIDTAANQFYWKFR